MDDGVNTHLLLTDNKINDLVRKVEKQLTDRAVRKPAGGVSVLPDRKEEVVQELTVRWRHVGKLCLFVLLCVRVHSDVCVYVSVLRSRGEQRLGGVLLRGQTGSV